MATMAAFEKEATDVAGQLDGMIRRLMSELEVVAACSKGRFTAAFIVAKNAIENEQRQMNAALTGIATDVGVAGRAYAAADAEQESNINPIGAALTGISSALG